MFNFNAFSNPDPLRIFLCRPSKEIICELNGIDDSSCSLDIVANDQFHLSFDCNRYVNDRANGLCESNGYHLLCTGMYLFVEKIGYFLMEQPTYSSREDNVEIKSVVAYSRDSELEKKDLIDYKINTGEKDSLEMLVAYETNEQEQLINEYTDLPYDYIVFYDTRSKQLNDFIQNNPSCPNSGSVTDSTMIQKIKDIVALIPRLKNKVVKNTTSSGNVEQSVIEYVKIFEKTATQAERIDLNGFMDRIRALIPFYEKYRSQLSLLDLAIENSKCGWKIGYVDPMLANKKFQFDISSQNIYSFLREDISRKAHCIIDFDIVNMLINVIAIENYGKATGINISRKNLQNTIEVSCDEDSIVTRYRVYGEDNFNINYVNFGNNRIDDLSYFLNARDIDGNRIYVSDSLANKYVQYVKDKDDARIKYAEYTKEYNRCQEELSELQYRVPNDKLSTNWSQFTKEELNKMLDTYYKLKAQLETMYKTDYRGKHCEGVGNYVNSDDSINIDALKTTEYWYDYEAYVLIISQIKETISKYPLYDTTNKDIMNAWKTDWSLFGTVELQAKIDAYKNTLKIGQESSVVEFDSNGSPRKWETLSESEKKEYNGEIGKDRYVMNYNEFLKTYNEMSSAQNYLDTKLKPQETALQKKLDEVGDARKKIMDLVVLEKYNRTELGKVVALKPIPEIGTNSFTPEEREIINLLYIDADYSNDNFFVTSIDDHSSTIDRQFELLEDAREQLSIESQPQFKFTSSLNNLLALPEFQDFASQFQVGNYMMFQYFDDYFVKLRLIKYSFNPRIPSDELTVEFSNFIKSRSKYEDTSFLLDNSGGSGGSRGSGGSGGSGGGKLGDGLDITLSNTLLSKLLNTETFGTAVTNVILDTLKLNSLTVKNATFDQLAIGNVAINGLAIKSGYIVSNNYSYPTFDKLHPVYNTNNTVGSIICMDDGTFNFAGGLLKGYKDPQGNYKVDVVGKISAIEGNLGGWEITQNGIEKETTDYKVSLMPGTNADKNYLSVYDKKTATTPFYVRADGSMYASGATIVGNVTANRLTANTAGEIAGWKITANNLSKNFTSTTANKDYRFVLRTAGGSTSHGVADTIRMIEVVRNTVGQKDYKAMFYVGNDGYLFATDAKITGDIDAINITAKDEYKLYSPNYFSQVDGVTSPIAPNTAFTIIGAGVAYERPVVGFGNSKIATSIDGSYLFIECNASARGNFSVEKTLTVNGTFNIESNMNILNNKYIITENSAYAKVGLIGWSAGNNIRLGEFNGSGKIIAKSCMIAATNVHKYGSGGWQSLSDERYKFGYKPINNARDFIMGLEPSMYKFTDGTSDRFHMGFKAQTTQNLMDTTIGDTGLVVAYTFNEDVPVDLTNPDTYTLALRYEEFIAPHVMVTQEHDVEIKTLQSEVTLLKEEISTLKMQLASYNNVPAK